MLKKIILISLLTTYISFSQVENLQIAHPVYKLLERAESKGYLKNITMNDLPLQRSQVIEALNQIESKRNSLSDSEKSTLDNFLLEFGIKKQKSFTLFSSSSDTNQILFDGLFSDDEKFVYRYIDSKHSVSLSPLASSDNIIRYNDGSHNAVIIGHLGFRLFGTLGNSLGYNLRVTNGSVLSGDKDISFIDQYYSQNIKFAILNSDVDYTESHIRYQNDWFYAGIGREYRLTGSGYRTRLVMSDNSPAFDALTLGARFHGFEYKFMHSSLLALPQTHFGWETGPNIEIVPKYMVTHRFSVRPSWGEISFWENIIYSNRFYDLAYLNPLSFLKSLEHSLRDRDNSGMGVDATIRIFDNLQIKGTYFLDDVIFSNIGTGYWGNKSALNVGLMYSPDLPVDLGIEYTRVEPFTFSHFNVQNSMTNDGFLVGSYLQPNSDKLSFFGNIWWGNRFPIEFNISYLRHGKNIYDSQGNLVRNVGGSALQTRRSEDPYDGYFLLDGDAEFITTADVKAGWEIIRGFNIQTSYRLVSLNSDIKHYFRLVFRIDEF